MTQGTTQPEGVGPIIEQAFSFAQEYMLPAASTAKDPVSETEVPIYTDKDGVHQIPPAIFDGYLTAPRFRHGTANLTDLDSFIAHVQRFQSESSAVFACDSRENPSLTAVLNYHPAGADSDPAFGNHRSAFKFPLSDEWKAWHAFNGVENAMSMVGFAQFLEDRIVDVEHPADISFVDEKAQDFIDKLGGISKVAAPIKLLELSRGLSINENSVVSEAKNLQSGEGHITFQNEHIDSASGLQVDVPSMFVITIPVFRNGPYYRILARLRYRVRPGIAFWFELWRTDRVFDHAFKEAVEKVTEATKLPVLLGSPE